MIRFLLPALCVFSAKIVMCQQSALQPSVLEAYLQQPTVQVTWSMEVGRLDSAEAHVKVTAILAQNSASPTQTVTGVKVELGNHNGTDYVYLSQEQLSAIVETLSSLDSGIQAFRNKPSNTSYRYMGSAALRQTQPPFVHTLTASYYIAPDSSGLSLSSYTRQLYRFPDRRPADFAMLLSNALEQIKIKTSA